jgi:hypothetical protein
MNVCGKSADGKEIETEVMVPVAMIRLVLQVGHDDALFGFAPD